MSDKSLNDIVNDSVREGEKMLRDMKSAIANDPPLDTNKGEPMKTLPEILDPILVKLYYNGYTDRIAGITEHAEAVKNNWLSEAQEAIVKELMGCLPEKHVCDDSCNIRSNDWEVGHRAYKDAESNVIDEVRARLTAFIGHKEK